MRIQIEHKWQKMDDYTWRCQVFGGWILKCIHKEGKFVTVSTVFIEDKHGEWQVLPSEAPQ